MKISYNWLQEYFEKPLPNPKDLSDMLNMKVLEVEQVEEKDDDSIFEIKVTPNRASDCLSHIGIAKEIASCLKINQKKPLDNSAIESDFETSWNIKVESDRCIRYIAREVRGVVVSESPIELKRKLESIGQRSINTIVDITNLVMYEIGQPMHAFDVDKLAGDTITVASPRNLHFVTLDNKDIELPPETITIQDQESDLAIAGIKGGKKAEVDFKTKNILLESANFSSVHVRTISKKTGIQTDSSKRFENGLTPQLAQKALHLACFYIQKYASDSNTTFSNSVDIYPRPQKRPYTVGLSLSHITQKLGIEIPQSDVEQILSGLGIEFEVVAIRERILKHAHDAIGKPYTWGASVSFDAPDTFDCASLTSYVYSMAGIALPRISIDQYVFCKKISSTEALPGDLVFTNTGEDKGHGIHTSSKEFLPGTSVPDGVDHVGIYIGDNKVLHANSNTGDVVIEDISSSKYFKDIRGFGTCIDEEHKYVLRIPYERLDLKTEIDIIEEIGRIYGYEHISPVSLDLKKINTISTYDKIATIKSVLIDLGFDEVITYTFLKKGDISVVKPLAKDKAYIRKNLTQGIQEALELNMRNKELFAQEMIQIFEIGNVFTHEGEKTMIACAVASSNKKYKSKPLFEKVLERIFEKTGYKIDVSITDQQQILEIDLTDMLKIDFEIKNTLYPLESVVYEPFSLYPFMTRDIAVWARDTKSNLDIEKIIKEHAGDLLIRFDLFDQFTKDGRTSYAYRLVFQSFDRTLTDEEINPIMDNLYSILKADPDFEIR